jgi:beta-glucosidase
MHTMKIGLSGPIFNLLEYTMSKNALSVALASLLLVMPSLAQVQAVPSADPWPAIVSPLKPDAALEQRVSLLLSKMTIEQKVGQMIQAEIRSVTPSDVRKYALGSVLNGGGSFPGNNKQAKAADWLSLADAYHQAAVVVDGVRIPVLWGTDAVHGHNNVMGAVLYPHNIALGAANNPDVVQAIGAATAGDVAHTGIDWAFAPTVAVAGDYRWGRTYESYSENPAIVAALGAALVKGLQGQAGSPEFLSHGRVLATAKHFIGDGATAGGVDQGDAKINEAELSAIHGAGYRSTLAAGAQTVMVSFNSWQGQKLHGQKYLVDEVLKKRLGFDGLVVSDWNGIGQVSGCSNANCVQAVLAGIDLFMVPEEWLAFRNNLLQAVAKGQVPMSRIDDAVRRILRVKARAGLLDSQAPSARNRSKVLAAIGAPAQRQLARQAVRESLVLLKNRNGLLPLSVKQNVLVAGSAADDISRQSGGWTLTWQGTANSNADFPGATSIYSGIRTALQGQGAVEFNAAGNYSQKPDVAIVVIGEEPYAEGQGDRKDVNLSASRPADLALLKKLKADGIPVVTVLLSGRPLWVNPELNQSDAFVAAWLPGTEGAGIADVLFQAANGRIAYDFKGKLPFQWPSSPSHTQSGIGRQPETPLFALGFGLTYQSKDNVSDALPELGLAAQSGAPTELVLFQRGPVAPWKLSLGDKGGWSLPMTGSTTRSAQGAVTVSTFDRKVQEDSIRVVWAGSGVGQVFLNSASPQDLTGLRKAGGALLIDMMLESRPSQPVELRVDCGYPCGAKANLSDIMKRAPLNTWFTLSLDLACFEKAGAKLERVDTGMLIATSGTLKLGITGVRIVPNAADKALIRCDGSRE